MMVQARARALRISPRKMGLVAGLVRSRSVSDALVILKHTPKKSAKILSKVISSAAANATNNHRAELDTLQIDHIHIAHGPRLKRHFTAARGRARPYMKRTTHVSVILDASVTLPKSAKQSSQNKKASSARVVNTESHKKSAKGKK